MTITPTIHMNGTSAKMLLNDYENAYYAVDAAIESLAKVEFNARDYQFRNLHDLKIQIQDILLLALFTRLLPSSVYRVISVTEQSAK